MQSIRSRLAGYYAFALTVTMVAFGAAVYWERMLTAPKEAELVLDQHLADRAASVTELLRQQARAATVTDLSRQQARTGSRVTTGSFQKSRGPDSLRALVDSARTYFDEMGDEMFITDDGGNVVYTSPAAQSLSVAVYSAVISVMRRRPLPVGPGELPSAPGEHPLRYHLAGLDTTGFIRGGVLVAGRLVVDTTVLKHILVSMLMMAPLILVASGTLGYWLAGRSLRPVEVMIAELGAIQDGTSLNRRLAVPAGDDELSRLARKLNDMLGRVEHSFVALRRFTADASHELKTPLMVLRAGVERSLTHPQTPGEIVPALDETLRQINQMSELVNNLLTLARADEGRGSLVKVGTDLRTAVAEAAETAEILGDDRQIQVKSELPPYPVVLPVDAGRIRQLLMNLATNAVKYTPPGGKVTIRLVDGVENVTIAVIDTGIGIAPGDVPNVFVRFWRADLARSRTGEHPGTGLGLAISKWIAEAHGGTITAQSRPGRGSTFTVTLPKPEERPERPGPTSGE
ncbi:MAG: ATP-binding protein [Gemmatimonadales bacterium]